MNSVKDSIHDSNWKGKLSSVSNSNPSINAANESAIKLLPEVSSVLDVGCGTGDLMNFLKKKGILVKGTDISGEALLRAKEKGLETFKADLDEQLPFKDNDFDCAICVQVLMHVFDPLQLLIEMKRVSKKYVLINVPNHMYWRFRINFLRGVLPDVFDGRAAHIRFFSRKKIEKMLSDAGLEIVARDYTGKKFFPSFFSTGFTFLCKK
ncbi:MAG: methionine biosynthesis protein MetW [archaeon]|jgi:methionine biosynthesis protein MetW